MTWLLLVVIVVALVSVACLSFRDRATESKPTSSNSSFTPNPKNDKVILVKGWNEAEIRKIIRDFSELYEKDGYPAYTIEPHKQSEELYRLVFPQDIHPRLFVFLVNFLAYPFELDLTNRSLVVAGETTLTSDFEEIDSQLVGKRAILYVPEQDQERDVVYMQTDSGVSLANSFSEMKWRRVNDARLSNEVKNLISGDRGTEGKE